MLKFSLSTYRGLTRLLLLALVVHCSATSVIGAQELSTEILIETKLVATEVQDGDNFGAALAIDGDTMVVAAPWADIDGVENSGAVYLFERDSTTGEWVEQQRIMPDDGDYDSVNMALAIDDDTIVVGAYFATIEDFQEGAVYIFERDGVGDGWHQVKKLTDPSVGFGGHFGISVALDGELLAVGADMQLTSNGQVTLFEKDRGGSDNWGEVTTIFDSSVADGGSLEAFGSALAIAGDVMLVGAERADVSGNLQNDGAAYLFRRDEVNTDEWDYVTRFIAPGSDACVGGQTLSEFFANPESDTETRIEADRCAREDSNSDHDHFGGAVSFDGDTIVIGAYAAEGEDGSYAVGASHVFQPEPDGSDKWQHVAKLSAEDASQFGYFGGALALADDTILAGAHGSTIGSRSSQGAAYIFTRDADGAWNEVEKLIAHDGLSNTFFGDAVALDGQTRIVGAWGDDEARGAAYVQVTQPISEQPKGPAFESTGELVDNAILEDSTGVLLGAVEGTLTEPLPVWIHEVDTPDESLPSQAKVVGAFYNIGATQTTTAPREGTFALSLPVPEGIDTAHLALGVLPAAARRLEFFDTSNLWQPLAGDFDPELQVLSIALRNLFADGSTVVLMDHPDLAPLPSTEALTESDQEQAEPVFWIDCYGWSESEDTCGAEDEDLFKPLLKDAYDRYVAMGYVNPALAFKRIYLEKTEDGKPRRHRKVEVLTTTYMGNRLRDANSPDCANRVASYIDEFEIVEICYQYTESGPIAAHGVDLNTAVRHEMFHAFQHGFTNYHQDSQKVEATADPIGIYTNPTSIEEFVWISEGTAAAAEDSNPAMTRSKNFIRELHPIHRALIAFDRKTTSSLEKIGYEAQDFWVYFGIKKGLDLGYLIALFEKGASTTAADQFFDEEHQTSLGNEYWAWVKNQAMEKTIDFDKRLQSPCTIQMDLVGDMSTLLYPPGDAAAEVQGTLPRLTSQVVRIITTEKVGPITVAASVDDGTPDDYNYKVYLEGEATCVDIDDRERTFGDLPAGSVLYVIVSHLRYEAGQMLDYTVGVAPATEGEPLQ